MVRLRVSLRRLAPDTAFVVLPDGSGRLLDLAGSFYALSPSATGMLRETLRSGSATAAERVAASFAVAEGRVRQDLHVFLDDLRQRRLLQRAGDDVPTDRAVSRSLLGALGATYRCVRRTAARSWVLLALAYLSIRRLGWPRTLATWQAFHGPAPSGAADSEMEAIRAAAEATRTAAAWHPLHVQCKERSLCCWSLLRAAGVPAQLVVGVAFYLDTGEIGHGLSGRITEQLNRGAAEKRSRE